MDDETTRKLNIIFLGVVPLISLVFIGYFGADTRPSGEFVHRVFDGLHMGSDDMVVSAPEAATDSMPRVVASDNGYVLTFVSRNAGSYRVMYSTSTDGFVWDEPEVVAETDSPVLYASPIQNVPGEAVVYGVRVDQLNTRVFVANGSDGVWNTHAIETRDLSRGEALRYNYSGVCEIGGRPYIAIQVTEINTSTLITDVSLDFVSYPNMEDVFTVTPGRAGVKVASIGEDVLFVSSEGINSSSDMVSWNFTPLDMEGIVLSAASSPGGLVIRSTGGLYTYSSGVLEKLNVADICSGLAWHGNTPVLDDFDAVVGESGVAACRAATPEGGDIWVAVVDFTSKEVLSWVKISPDNTRFSEVSILKRSDECYVSFISDRWGQDDIFVLSSTGWVRVSATPGDESDILFTTTEDGLYFIVGTYSSDIGEEECRYVSRDLYSWSYYTGKEGYINYNPSSTFRSGDGKLLTVLSDNELYYNMDGNDTWSRVPVPDTSYSILVEKDSSSFYVYHITSDGSSINRAEYNLYYITVEDREGLERQESSSLGLFMSFLLLTLTIIYGLIYELGWE